MGMLILFILVAVTTVVIASGFKDVDVVARTIYAEAGGEGLHGMRAVASVIVNRSERDRTNPAKVCLQPFQFSCWNNRPPKKLPDISAGRQAREIAQNVCDGMFDPIGPWTHYCRTDCRPSWRAKMTRKAIIGNHVFGVLKK